MELDLIRRLSQPADTKVILCVLDGLGGMPGLRGRTELEEANTRNLDRLVAEGSIGRTLPVGFGITPGSGPGHMALFGYDPLVYEIGRGALESTGIGFEIGPEDITARGNLCTLDGVGLITDRRAGRLPTAQTEAICAQLQTITLPGVQTFVQAVQDQRFILVLRGPGLSDQITETDPQREGVPPIVCAATAPAGDLTAALVREWVTKATSMLAGQERANGVLLRGWSGRPNVPPFPELWKLRAAAVTVYPMYRGVARLVGMDVVDGGHNLDEQIAAIRAHWDQYDFFFLHYKYTDSAGEDGDFQRKADAIEAFDRAVPDILALGPDVLVVTGDHSTPSAMAAHSFHAVPIVVWGKDVRRDHLSHFNEVAAREGELGQFPAKEVLPIAFGHAGRLAKFGA